MRFLTRSLYIIIYDLSTVYDLHGTEICFCCVHALGHYRNKDVHDRNRDARTAHRANPRDNAQVGSIFPAPIRSDNRCGYRILVPKQPQQTVVHKLSHVVALGPPRSGDQLPIQREQNLVMLQSEANKVR